MNGSTLRTDRLVDSLAFSWWDRAAEAHAFVQAALRASALFTSEAVMNRLAMNSYARGWAMTWEAQR